MSLRTPRSDAGSDRPAGGSANGNANPPANANGNGENGVRERFDALSQPIREKLEDPISKVSTLTKRTMTLFPVRVWRHFLARNGFLLSSGMSYQALFAIFAAVYVVFAIAGIWLTGDPETLDAFVKLLNTYAPGLIGDDGLISTDELTEIATSSTSLFGLTGAVALAGLIWTAIGWVTYSRLAVRSIFGLPKDMRAYVLLKARDFLAALGFGTALVAAAVLSAVMTSFFGWLTDLIGIDPSSGWSTTMLAVGGFVVVFGIDTIALAVLFRFLSGASMPWRRMWIGSLLGSAALTLLQLASGWLVSQVSTNPLLATFTVFVALLLWFRLVSIVILVAASWVAVEASDHNESLRRVTAEELLAEERERERMALVTAARIKVREARAALDAAQWWERIPARRRLAKAEEELVHVEADAAASTAQASTGKVGGLP